MSLILLVAIIFYFYCHSIQLKVRLNTAFIIHRVVKQLHVSILIQGSSSGLRRNNEQRSKVHIIFHTIL
jgi:hypothetical protein